MPLPKSKKIAIFSLFSLALLVLGLTAFRQFIGLVEDAKEHWQWVLPLALATFLPILWLAWRFTHPKPQTPVKVSRESLEEKISHAESLGVDVESIKEELQALDERREKRRITLALFGQVNTGKSALVRALTGEAEALSSPKAGETRKPVHYRWQDIGSNEVWLIDTPGRDEVLGTSMNEASWDAAMSADLILYLTDGDLTRNQLSDIEMLLKAHKPLLIAINKADWYSEAERKAIEQAVLEKIAPLSGQGKSALQAVTIQSGGKERVIIENERGETSEAWRERSAVLEPLAEQAIALLKKDKEAMLALAETVFVGHLYQSVKKRIETKRAERADEIISKYAKAAVLAALAAVVPGIEVVLLGAIGMRMANELNETYGQPMSSNKLDSLLQAVAGQFKDISSLSGIITGNVLKAFPGLGTAAGGVVHAVTYGFVMRGVGRTLVSTMENNETLGEEEFLARLDDYFKNANRAKELSELIQTVKKEL